MSNIPIDPITDPKKFAREFLAGYNNKGTQVWDVEPDGKITRIRKLEEVDGKEL